MAGSVSSVSQLFSAVYGGLGQPEDQFLSKIDLSNILFRQLAYRLEGVRQSEQRISIAKSSTFTLSSTEDEKDLTTLESDFVIPLWVERQSVDWLSHPVWQFVPTVNLSHLQARRASGEPACAFYGDTPLQVKVKFSYFGNEVPSPCATTQVWYSPTVPFPQTESAAIDLPDNLINMVTLDCRVYSIPIMITNASKYIKDQPQLSAMIDAWKFLLLSAEEERARFEKLFLLWQRGSRGAHRSRRRRDVLDSNVGTSWIFGIQNPTP